MVCNAIRIYTFYKATDGFGDRNILFIDDLEKNIVAAEKAGLKTFWLTEELEIAELF